MNKQIGDYLKNSKIWSPKYIMHVNSIEDEGQYLNVILRVRLKKDWKWQDYTRWRKVKNDVSIANVKQFCVLIIFRCVAVVGDPKNNGRDGHPDRTLPELHPLDGQRGYRCYVEEKGAVRWM